MLFAPLINIIFGISTSNNVGISNIYAKKQEIGVGPQVNIYRPFWASFTGHTHMHRDSLVHREFHSPDVPSLMQVILCWMP